MILKIYQHYKGGWYRLICCANLEADGGQTQMAVYQSLETGKVWVRPASEFFGQVPGRTWPRFQQLMETDLEI